jgi:hypothetical protein
MVTTRRGWWPAFGPALLAFTVVVCGSASLLEISHASVFDDSHPSATTGLPRGIAFAPGGDLFASRGTVDSGDSGPDGDEVVDAFIAAAVVMIAADDSRHSLVPTEFNALSAPGSARPTPRGPPAPAHPAYSQEDFGREQNSDVIADDDDRDDDDDYDNDDDGRDDDGGATDPGSRSHTVGRGSSSALIRSEVDALVSFTSADLSLRAPPL